MKPPLAFRPALRLLPRLTALLLLASSWHAPAQTFSSITVGASPLGSAQNLFNVPAGTLSAQGGTSDSYGTSTSLAYAYGQPGVLKASAFGIATAPRPLTGFQDKAASAGASASLDYWDHVTLLAPGIPVGTPGSAVFHIDLPGTIAVSTQHGGPTGWTPIQFGAKVQAYGTFGSIQWNYVEGWGSLDHPLDTGIPSSVDIPVTFQFGVPLDIRLGLSVGGSATVNANRFGFLEITGDTVASFDLDFADSLYWGGITEVTGNGSPLVPGTYSATNDGGLDFTSSLAPSEIPEPGATIAGLVLLLAAVFRRRPLRGQPSA